MALIAASELPRPASVGLAHTRGIKRMRLRDCEAGAVAPGAAPDEASAGQPLKRLKTPFSEPITACGNIHNGGLPVRAIAPREKSRKTFTFATAAA
jgi:hypothetical protein